ncbi:O-antigen ligase family protein [Halomonas sp. HP20-15]|uniref:O-antigen ligase family protein n=1 Tax=Halomonas sp. HP20-15 TaxID=3085901 RepID=UPI00298164C5|nr:O-antigen ligase family protein [Halomonas sp. HP20-15]MDW5377013.1 O-antigen ligase family protein [Halomonas sp. HP20-15]
MNLIVTRHDDRFLRGATRPSASLGGSPGGVWSAINTFLVGGFVALLIVWYWGFAVLPLAALLAASVGFLATLGRCQARLDREDGLLLLALLVFAGVWLVDVLRSGVWPQPLGGDGRWLPLWPALAAGLLVWLRCHTPSARGWLLGLLTATLGAGAIACYERGWIGLARADNSMNAIPFGNLALLLGALSLIAMLGRLGSSRRRARWLTVMLGVAACSGFVASLLSGTRGGWVALPLLFWLIYRSFKPFLPMRHVRGPFIILGTLLILVVCLPQTGVAARLVLAVDDVQRYYMAGETATSLGLRLEMWRGGLALFADRPVTGWGEDRLEAARDARIVTGELDRGVSDYDQLQSDFIDTAARRGMLGVLSLAGLYGVPLLLFSRHLRSAKRAWQRTLALSGIVIVVAFIDFGLSQSLLRDSRGLAGYLGLCTICWTLLKAQAAPFGVESRGVDSVVRAPTS